MKIRVVLFNQQLLQIKSVRQLQIYYKSKLCIPGIQLECHLIEPKNIVFFFFFFINTYCNIKVVVLHIDQHKNSY